MEGQVQSQVSSCEIYGGQSGNGKGFSRSTTDSPLRQYHSTNDTHLHLHVALIRKTNMRRLGTFEKEMIYRKLGEGGHWREKFFHFWSERVKSAVFRNVTPFGLKTCRS